MSTTSDPTTRPEAVAPPTRDPFTCHRPGTAIRRIADNRDLIIGMRRARRPETEIAEAVGLTTLRMQAAIADWNFRYPHLRIEASAKSRRAGTRNRDEAVRLAGQGLKFAEIAERMGLSPVTVRFHLQQARKEGLLPPSRAPARGFSAMFAKMRAGGRHPKLGSMTTLAGALPREMFLRLLDESMARGETLAATVARHFLELANARNGQGER